MDRPRMRKPNLFIVGEPKSGTTALHDFLGQHPDIFMSPYKEPRYFCSDLHRESDRFHGGQRFFPIRTERQWLELFEGAGDERILGESSPQYLISREAADRIASFNPCALIVVLFRDPVDLLYSLFLQLHTNSDEDAPDLEKALALEPERRQGRSLSRFVGCPSYLYYSEWIRFADHLSRYLDAFGPEQILVRTFDDLRADVLGLYRAVLQFVGVDDRFEPTLRVVNPTTVGRLPRLRRLVRSRFVWRYIRPRIPVRLFERTERLLHRVFDHPVEKQALPDEVRARLRARFYPEVEKLSALIDRDLVTEWGYSDLV